MGIFFDLKLQPLGHRLLSRGAVHPFRFGLVMIAGDLECSAGVADWGVPITFLAPEFARPTATGRFWWGTMA